MPRLGSRVRVSFSALSDVLKMAYAQVAELVDAHVSGACVERHAGSSPVLGTKVGATFYEMFRICRRGGGIGRRATLRG